MKVIMNNGETKICDRIEFFKRYKSNTALLVTKENDFEEEKNRMG